MKHFFCILLILLSVSLFSVNIELLNSDQTVRITGNFELNKLETRNYTTGNRNSLYIKDCVNTGNVGEAELPVYTKLVTLPETGNFEINDAHYDYDEIQLDHPLINVGWQDEISSSDAYYQQNIWFPKAIVKISDPNIIRSHRFAQISVAAVQYNPVLNKIRRLKNIQIELELNLSNTKNPLIKQRPSAAFDRIAAENILGTENQRSAAIGNYLFIAPDVVEDTIQPLLRAKEKLGHKTRLALLSETGSNENQIKDFIQHAYDNWEYPPEYVVLIGDVNGSISLPAFYVDGYLYPTCVTDHTYTLLDGTDYFPDVLIGRLSVRSDFELQTIIAKIINYEFNPYVETDWMTRAMMVSYVQDYYWQFYSPRETVMAVREKLLDFEYTVVDTFIAPWNSGSSNLRNMIDTGYTFVNYRGCGAPDYWAGPYGSMFDINDIIQLNNGSLLPFITSITCGGGNFAYLGINSVFGETWLNTGTPSFPKGAIGFIGPSEHDTKTWFNNANDMGIYQGITQEELYRGGEMLLRGKMELYNNYPFSHAWGNSLNSDQFYFYVYNLLGDPGLPVMTRMPQNIVFNCPTEISTYDNFMPVSITQPALAAADFLIAITNDDSLVATGTTDGYGQVNIPIQHLPEGTYNITASKYGYIPSISSFDVVYQDKVIATNILCNDAYAGQTTDFAFDLVNMTPNTENVSVEFSTENDFIEVFNPGFSGQISAGGTQIVIAQFAVDNSWLDTEPFEIIIFVTSSNGTDQYLLTNYVKSPQICFSEMNVANQDECLLPNQLNIVYVELMNCGSLSTAEFQVELISLNDNAIINNGTSTYPAITQNGHAWNQNAFQVECTDVMSGETASLKMNISVDYELVQEMFFAVPIGVITEESPTFCDYGYFALEDQDSGNFIAPIYDWIEIDPGNGGSGTHIDPDHSTTDGAIAKVNLPFDFQYFGETYDKVSICTNGYLSMGETELIFHRNRMIPSGCGAKAMIAPFWDALTNGDVYYKYFPDNNTFVVEWSEMRNVYNFSYETFQVILYDPAHYPTETGDGNIKFQYKDIQNVDQGDQYATVGIENYEQTAGIQMTFANIYASTAHMLQDESAIFFSTGSVPIVGNNNNIITSEFIDLQNYPNPFNPVTKISFNLPQIYSSASIVIYNLKGQKVKSIPINPSTHQLINSVTWNGTDNYDKPVTSGIYFYTLSINGESVDSRKCLLLK